MLPLRLIGKPSRSVCHTWRDYSLCFVCAESLLFIAPCTLIPIALEMSMTVCLPYVHLFSWSQYRQLLIKQQTTIAHSSTDVEQMLTRLLKPHRSGVGENLLAELHLPVWKILTIYCSNIGAMYLWESCLSHSHEAHCCGLYTCNQV